MNNIHASFAQRLRSLLAQRGKPLSATALAREFNLRWRGMPVSVTAVRKWLLGYAMPRMDKIQVLAAMLGASSDWLRWGDKAGLGNDLAKQPDTTPVPSALHDWALLTAKHRELVVAMLEVLLKHQARDVNAADGCREP